MPPYSYEKCHSADDYKALQRFTGLIESFNHFSMQIQGVYWGLSGFTEGFDNF